MRIVLLTVVIITYSCVSNSRWTKQEAYKKCMNEAIDIPTLDTIIGKKNIYKLCDCVSEKAVAAYSSEKESEKDSVGFSEISSLCLDIMVRQLNK